MPNNKKFISQITSEDIYYVICFKFEYFERGINMRDKDIRKECEELWAKNKYFVLSKSHKAYLEIREYLKGTKLDILYLNEKIHKTVDMKESKKDFSNAILHIWGYFKKDASIIEKQTLFDILNKYMDGKNTQKHVIEYINTLLKKYPNEYLQKSTLLTGEQYETMA